MKLLLRVGVFAIVLIGGFIFRDQISGSGMDLKVGHCFDIPANDDFRKVQHHPCSEPHTAEVVYIADHPAAKGSPYTDHILNDFGRSTCVPALHTYIGTTEGDRIAIGAVFPGPNGWTDGNRKVTCYAYLVDGSSVSASFKAS